MEKGRQQNTLPQDDDPCEDLLKPLHSPGIWNTTDDKGFLDYPLPGLHLQLGIIFILTQSLHMLLKRFHLSRIVSEILTGIILGPTFLGSIPGFTETFLPACAALYLDLLSKIGFILFMFLIGVKMEPSLVMRTGKKVWSMGFASVFIPIFVAMTVSPKLGFYIDNTALPPIKYTILTQTMSPFPVVACLLVDLQIINSELGRVALAVALIRDLLSLSFHTPLNYIRVSTQGSSFITGGLTLIMFLLFIIITVFIIRPMFLWIIRQTPEGKQVDGAYIAFISFGVLLSAIICDYLGTQYYHGPLILGLAIPVGPPLGSTLVERFDTFATGFLAPLLMTFCGMKTEFRVIYDLGFIYILWIVIFGGTLTKFLSTFLPALTWKMPLKDATALALILSTQGIVEMAGILSNTQNQTLNIEAFSMVTLSVLLSAVIIPLLARFSYDFSRTYIGYQKRNILQSANNAELRIFVCVHRQEDALAAIKLLEVSNPTRESPVGVHVLHLMELLGRASPLLINHKFGQKTSSTASRSRQIINVFNSFEDQFLGLVNVQAFTAISMPKFMHHDICSLAFDKLMSLIILPFHRKWNAQGKMILDNNTLRSINHQVMEMAPCSVGILVDRRKMQRTGVAPATSLYRVAVLFLGGDDDREALAYAKRMAKSPAVHLTVLRLVAAENTGEDNWETMLDIENLRDVRLQSSLRGNVNYREHVVENGPGTSLIIRAMEEVYDLIMVGRRHRLDSPLLSGLLEWTELPELGAIGDLLASPDISQPVSVLVVQQQHTMFNKVPTSNLVRRSRLRC